LLRPSRVKINAAYYQKHKETIKIRNAAKAAAKKQAKLAHYERLRIKMRSEAERERRRASRKKYKREEKERERAREAKKQKRFEELRENYPKR